MESQPPEKINLLALQKSPGSPVPTGPPVQQPATALQPEAEALHLLEHEVARVFHQDQLSHATATERGTAAQSTTAAEPTEAEVFGRSDQPTDKPTATGAATTQLSRSCSPPAPQPSSSQGVRGATFGTPRHGQLQQACQFISPRHQAALDTEKGYYAVCQKIQKFQLQFEATLREQVQANADLLCRLQKNLLRITTLAAQIGQQEIQPLTPLPGRQVFAPQPQQSPHCPPRHVSSTFAPKPLGAKPAAAQDIFHTPTEAVEKILENTPATEVPRYPAPLQTTTSPPCPQRTAARASTALRHEAAKINQSSYVSYPPDLARTGATLQEQLLAAPRDTEAPLQEVEVPVFDGTNFDVTTWLRTLEVAFMALGLIEDLERLRWTRAHIEGPAAEYFETIQGVPTWAEFRSALQERFRPFGVEYRHRANFYNLHQEGENITEYISEFRRRFHLVPEVSQREALYAFQKGLNPEVRLHVNAELPTTVAQAIDLARRWQTAHSQESLHAPLPAEATIQLENTTCSPELNYNSYSRDNLCNSCHGAANYSHNNFPTWVSHVFSRRHRKHAPEATEHTATRAHAGHHEHKPKDGRYMSETGKFSRQHSSSGNNRHGPPGPDKYSYHSRSSDCPEKYGHSCHIDGSHRRHGHRDYSHESEAPHRHHGQGGKHYKNIDPPRTSGQGGNNSGRRPTDNFSSHIGTDQRLAGLHKAQRDEGSRKNINIIGREQFHQNSHQLSRGSQAHNEGVPMDIDLNSLTATQNTVGPSSTRCPLGYKYSTKTAIAGARDHGSTYPRTPHEGPHCNYSNNHGRVSSSGIHSHSHCPLGNLDQAKPTSGEARGHGSTYLQPQPEEKTQPAPATHLPPANQSLPATQQKDKNNRSNFEPIYRASEKSTSSVTALPEGTLAAIKPMFYLDLPNSRSNDTSSHRLRSI